MQRLNGANPETEAHYRATGLVSQVKNVIGVGMEVGLAEETIVD